MSRTDFPRFTSACFGILLFCLSISGCQVRRVIDARGRAASEAGGGNVQEPVGSSGGEADSTKGGQVLVEGGVPNKPEICSALEKPCESGGTPSFCSVSEIAGARLNAPYKLAAHAKSECEARKAVLDSACKRGIDIKSLDTISCGPDKSEGKCPAEAGMCITLYDPSRCVASNYADAALNADEKVAGWGSNSCVARIEMRRFACSLNQNPDKLSDVQCERVPNFQGDCPPVQPACDVADKTPATCEVAVGAAPAKVTANGSGACLARFNLEWQLCLAGHSPAALVNSIKCDQTR